MKAAPLAALFTLLMALPVGAQGVDPLADAIATSLLDRFEVVSGNLLAAAERIPEEHYDFQPTEEVRTVAEQFTHVAAAHFGYCAAVGGQPAPAAARGAITSKAEIVERLRASRDFCLGVYRGASGMALADEVNVFGNNETRVFVLVQNIAHDNSHYGNIVTYMRLLGLVPPSSE